MNPKQKLAVLCNELATIRQIAGTVRQFFELVWIRDASGLHSALKEQSGQELAAVMIDNSSAHVNAIQLLQLVREQCPQAKRILLSDYCDLAIIVQGLHSGAVQQIVYKPIYAPELLAAIGGPVMKAALAAARSAGTGVRAAG